MTALIFFSVLLETNCKKKTLSGHLVEHASGRPLSTARQLHSSSGGWQPVSKAWLQSLSDRLSACCNQSGLFWGFDAGHILVIFIYKRKVAEYIYVILQINDSCSSYVTISGRIQNFCFICLIRFLSFAKWSQLIANIITSRLHVLVTPCNCQFDVLSPSYSTKVKWQTATNCE